MIKYNYHTHLYLCGHAKGTTEDYVQMAIKNNYEGLGISDHGPSKSIWKTRMTEEVFYSTYLNEINAAKKKYQNQIAIYKGLEIEYYEEYTKRYQEYLQHLDYLILGQHLTSKNNYDVFCKLPYDAFYEYKEDVVKGLNTGYFKILAHPDVIFFRNDIWNEEIENLFKEIIDAAIKNDVYLELNCNCIRKGLKYLSTTNEETYAFPRIELWKLISQYKDVKIIIGVDAHDPEHLESESIEVALEFADKLGLNVHKRIENLLK